MAAEQESTSPFDSEKQYSPAARAFFAALDGSQDPSVTGKQGGKVSSSIQKRIQTLGWRKRYSQDDRYPITVGEYKFSVLQVQRGELEGTYGTGATVWPASVVLVKYLERHAAKLLQDKRVVDLGAGTGVTSIAAALLGASHCVCTDGELSVVQLARDNIHYTATNELAPTANESATTTAASAAATDEGPSLVARIRDCPVPTEKYWWGTGQIQAMGGVPCNVVLVSDCVLPKLYPIAPLVDALDQLLVAPQAVAILSYEHRYFAEYDPRDKFRELCQSKQLAVQVIPMEEQDPVYSVEDIEIWHVTRDDVDATESLKE